MVTSSLLEVSTWTCTELSVSLRKLLTWPVGKVTFVRRPKLSYLKTNGVVLSNRNIMVLELELGVFYLMPQFLHVLLFFLFRCISMSPLSPCTLFSE